MPIPDYQECMLPMLELCFDGNEWRVRELTNLIADRFKLSDEERAERLPSGQQTIIANRVGWARTYLVKAGLLASPCRGAVKITDEGKAALATKPAKLDKAFLEKYASFQEFVDRSATESQDVETDQGATPEELLESAYAKLRSALADELLDRVKSSSPSFFEQLVVDLLVAMGYGGSIADAGKAIGKSGDGGIDGIIKEDKLGLDFIGIQAKRWQGTVGRPDVQAFAGSLEGARARKGVMITTSTFSKDAHEYVKIIERKIVLIDGQRLAQLMIDYNVGVTTSQSYLIKRIDLDFFEDGGG